MTSYSIKQATTEIEWQQVKILQHQLLVHEKSLRPQRSERSILSEGPLRYLKENIAAHQGACFIATDQKGNIIGFLAGWIEAGDGLDEGDNRIGKICDVCVVPEFRGCGVFTSLLQGIFCYFQHLNISQLSIDTLGTNTVMQQVLQKLGFGVHRIIYEKKIAQK